MLRLKKNTFLAEKKFGEKMAFFTQYAASFFAKNGTITMCFFKENANFLAKNWLPKLARIVKRM
jgi:hypothetical protein